MLKIIGLGLKPKHLTLEALEQAKSCKQVFLETYTSVYSEGSVAELERLIGKKVAQAGRKSVEDDLAAFVAKAKKDDIALLVFGNPLSATTHIEILLECKKQNVKCNAFAGISVFDFLGKTGLSQYKFGRTTTIVGPEKNFAPESFYDVVAENSKAGLHSLCLLDINAEKARLMPVKAAIELLEAIEKKRGKSAKIIANATLVGLSQAGSAHEKIFAGKAADLKLVSFGVPACLIVCGRLSDKEKEALAELAKNA